MLVEAKLDIGPVTEDFSPHPDLVWPDIELADNVLDKGQHFVIVGLSNTARRVKDEEHIGLGSAGRGSVVSHRFGHWKSVKKNGNYCNMIYVFGSPCKYLRTV